MLLRLFLDVAWAASRRVTSQTNGFPIAATSERSIVELEDNRGFYPFLFAEAGSWAYQSFNVQVPAEGGLITVTDAFCAGDAFEVYSQGRRIERRSIWEGLRVEERVCEEYEDRPFEAWNDARFNSGTYFLKPGHQKVTIKVRSSPIGGGMGFVFYAHTLEYGRGPICNTVEDGCYFGYDPTAPWEIYQKRNDTSI